jgi:hypothetical protein
MHAESTITCKVYKFELLKEESTTVIHGFVCRCFVKDYNLGANDIIKFEISVNLYFSNMITPCDHKGTTKYQQLLGNMLNWMRVRSSSITLFCINSVITKPIFRTKMTLTYYFYAFIVYDKHNIVVITKQRELTELQGELVC